MSGGMCIAIMIASLKFSHIRTERIFHFGRVLWLRKWIFLFGRMWWFWNDKASHGQINGSNEVTFGTLLEGTVLFLPVKQLRAETSYRHPRWVLKITRKYCTLGGCIGLARARWLNRRTYGGNATCYFGRVCDCYWEWPWPWQWSEQWLPLQVSRTATALWPWPWMALMAHYLDLRSDTKHCFPDNKWQIYTKGL